MRFEESGPPDGVKTDCRTSKAALLEPRYASGSRLFRLEHQLQEPDGTWMGAAWLLVTSTSQPTLLGLPLAMAYLGWAGGLVVLVVAGLYTLYASLLLAALHEYGGRRHHHYRKLAKDIMGPSRRYAYALIQVPQYINIVGCGIANLIVAAQCLGAICGLFHDTCPIRNYQWTLMAGGVLAVLVQAPDMGSIGALTALSSFFMVFYSTAAVALAAVQGGGRDADYSLAGSDANVVLNAFNGIGMVVFCYTNPIIPEIQAVVRDDPATASAYPPMRTALLASYALIISFYILVSTVGYWAYGAAVGGFLLAQSTHPIWLLVLTNLMAVTQLLVGEQVVEYLLFETGELHLVARFPNTACLHKTRVNEQGRLVKVPSRLTMLLVRLTYVASITVLAAAFPFFTQIMGLVGALGLTPICLVLPPVLFVMARGKAGAKHSSADALPGGKPSGAARLASALALARDAPLQPWVWWGHVGWAALWSAVGLLAAIGSVRAIVVAIQDHDFFS